jgi:NTP pyrophosphatase (non-canonical NTP hydrolase)
MQNTLRRISKFTTDRDWDQFHSPANLSKSIIIEAAELLENFQWDDSQFDLEKVEEELADVLIYCLQLSEKMGLDPIEIINNKMDKNEQKYPVEQSFGSSKKYTELNE